MDAIPLLPHPTLDHYAMLAASLRDVRADGSDAATDWTKRYLDVEDT